MKLYLSILCLILVALLSSRAIAAGTPTAASEAANEPELPRVFLSTPYTPATGSTITVRSGENLQTALNAAMPGDEVVLEAGATFVGNFTLRNKSGTGWIIIRTSNMAGIPAEGTRVNPSAHAAAMPKILSPNASAAIATESSAHNYRLVGLEVGVTSAVSLNYGLILLGRGSETSSDQLPRDLVVDRCYINGNATGDIARGIALNSISSAILDSYISNCHGKSFDTQAMCGWNGPGPFKIVNNYLEGAGENVMFGGADPKIQGLVPSDIEFRRNLCSKPLSWNPNDPSYAGVHWSTKNLFELKNAQRVLVDGNIFENNWVDGQNGTAILFTVRNQDGSAPWSVVQDVNFTNNIVRHSASAVVILGYDYNFPSQQTRRLRIQNNLFDDIGAAIWGGNGRLFGMTDGAADVKIDHNTAFHTYNVISVGGGAHTGFAYTNNLTPHNQYGVTGDGTGVGSVTINTYFPDSVFAKNVLMGGPSSLYPAGNYFPATWEEVGFVARLNGDYRLAPGSPYKGAGTDGKDIGADIDAIEAAIRGTSSNADITAPVISGIAASSITPSSADIDWTTDEPADSQVEYGPTSSYGNSTTLDTLPVTGHRVGLGGLLPDTTYYYRVKSRDSAGNLSVSTGFTFRTLATDDTVPPVISAVSSSNLTAESARITWSTNEPGDSQVEYGATTAYGSMTQLDASLVTDHGATLNALQPNTLYHYRVISRDAAGNLSASGDYTFTTAPLLDTAPPVISGVTAGQITPNGATITWLTDEPSDSQVEYGRTSNFGSQTPVAVAMVTSHAVTLGGLLPDKTYYYKVKSKDAQGNLSVSATFTFRTLKANRK